MMAEPTAKERAGLGHASADGMVIDSTAAEIAGSYRCEVTRFQKKSRWPGNLP